MAVGSLVTPFPKCELCRWYHTVKGVVRGTDAHKFEQHCCEAADCEHVFEKVACDAAGRKQWQQRRNELCPSCGLPRFRYVGKVLGAAKRCAGDLTLKDFLKILASLDV